MFWRSATHMATGQARDLDGMAHGPAVQPTSRMAACPGRLHAAAGLAARARLVISGVWLALFALVIGLAAASGPQQTEAGGNGGANSSVNVFDLRTGQCFHNPAAGETLFGVTYVSVLPCTAPHNAQVFGQF